MKANPSVKTNEEAIFIDIKRALMKIQDADSVPGMLPISFLKGMGTMYLHLLIYANKVMRQIQKKLTATIHFLFERVGTGQPESRVRRKLLIVYYLIIFEPL